VFVVIKTTISNNFITLCGYFTIIRFTCVYKRKTSTNSINAINAAVFTN